MLMQNTISAAERYARHAEGPREGGADPAAQCEAVDTALSPPPTAEIQGETRPLDVADELRLEFYSRQR
eukprot:5294743-Prymnesium_polylepis.1